MSTPEDQVSHNGRVRIRSEIAEDVELDLDAWRPLLRSLHSCSEDASVDYLAPLPESEPKDAKMIDQSKMAQAVAGEVIQQAGRPLLRFLCLRLAAFAVPHRSPSAVVGAAKQFEEFVMTGEAERSMLPESPVPRPNNL